MNQIIGILAVLIALIAFGFATGIYAENMTNGTIPLNATSAEIEALNITGIIP